MPLRLRAFVFHPLHLSGEGLGMGASNTKRQTTNNKPQMNYKASFDNLTKNVTIGVTILFAFIFLLPIIIIKDGSDNQNAIYTRVAMLLFYFITYGFSTKSYQLTPEEVIIRRLLGNVKIKRSEILSIEIIEKEQMGWIIRTFGVGGLFGYWGKFSSSKLGSMTWYATRKNRIILIKTINNKRFVITPDEMEQFVSDFNSSTIS